MLCLEELPLSAHCLDTNTPLVVNEIQLGRPVAIQHDFLSLAGFSLQSASRMAGTPEYDIRRNFYNMGDYAHQFILNMWDADDGAPMFSERPSYLCLHLAFDRSKQSERK